MHRALRELQWRVEPSGKVTQLTTTSKTGGAGALAEGTEELGLSWSLRKGQGGGGWGLRPKGRRQEELQVDQEKQTMQGLEKPGLAAQSPHLGEKIEEGPWDGGGGQAAPPPKGNCCPWDHSGFGNQDGQG